MMQTDPDAVTAPTHALTATGLAADAQPPETLGWIALAPGLGWTGDQRQVQVTAGDSPVPLATAFNRRFPVVLQALCPPWEPATATAAGANRSRGLQPARTAGGPGAWSGCRVVF